MSVARCATCGLMSRRLSAYSLVVEPVGYPDSSTICGSPGCENPALIWLTAWEASEFRSGRRVFSVAGRAPKVRVNNEIRPIPHEQSVPKPPAAHGDRGRSGFIRAHARAG
jgi:hypothetical protein